MGGITYDTTVLIAAERGDRQMWSHQGILRLGAVSVVPAPMLAQAWRGGSRQATLARLLAGCEIEESVLDRPIGSTTIMRAQLEHLIAMSERDNVEPRYAAQRSTAARRCKRGGTHYVGSPTPSSDRHAFFGSARPLSSRERAWSTSVASRPAAQRASEST
jgi:Domain of unknown function (DUF5753)